MSKDVKKLKVLLPELLPAPSEVATTTVRDRISARAQLFLQRFRGLGTAAGAAVFSLHCGGYSVVDPLPPPAQQCSAAPDPFTSIQAQARVLDEQDAGVHRIELRLFSLYSAYRGFHIQTARVSGGTLIRIDDITGQDLGSSGSQFLVVLAPDPGATILEVGVDIGCGAATRTKRYRLTFSTTAPVNGQVAVEVLNGDTDAGV